MVLERGQVAPRGVAGEELHRAGAEHQAEEEPTEEPDDGGGRLRLALDRRPELERGQEDREKAALEQQDVPLEGEKILTDRLEREIGEPESCEAGDRGEAYDQQDRKR